MPPSRFMAMSNSRSDSVSQTASSCKLKRASGPTRKRMREAHRPTGLDEHRERLHRLGQPFAGLIGPCLQPAQRHLPADVDGEHAGVIAVGTP